MYGKISQANDMGMAGWDDALRLGMEPKGIFF